MGRSSMTTVTEMFDCTCKDGKRRGKTCEWCNGTGSFAIEVDLPEDGKDGNVRLERAQAQKDLF